MAQTTENTDRISERRKKREKKQKRSWIFKIVFILIGIYFISLLIPGLHKPLTTYTAQTGTIEEFITADGYIFRDQSVLNAPQDGIFRSEVQEGDRVNEGEVVAYIYQSDVDPAVVSEIRDLEEQIAALEEDNGREIYANTVVSVEQRIADVVKELKTQRSAQNLQAVGDLKTELNQLIDKKRAITGERPADEELLTTLKDRLAGLEAGIDSERVPVVAPVGGIYTSRIDGFEDALQLRAAESLTPGTLEALDQQVPADVAAVQKDQPVCKIVNNYTWCFAANFDEAETQNLTVGQSVRLRFYDMTDSTIYGVIQSISMPERGKVTVVISTNRYVESIYSTSRAAAEVLTASFEGIKIPAQSLRVQNEQTGVYVVRLDAAHFVPVNLLYKNDEWAIVSAVLDTNAAYTLQIYDEVIVEGRDIEEGKVVR